MTWRRSVCSSRAARLQSLRFSPNGHSMQLIVWPLSLSLAESYPSSTIQFFENLSWASIDSSTESDRAMFKSSLSITVLENYGSKNRKRAHNLSMNPPRLRGILVASLLGAGYRHVRRLTSAMARLKHELWEEPGGEEPFCLVGPMGAGARGDAQDHLARKRADFHLVSCHERV